MSETSTSIAVDHFFARFVFLKECYQAKVHQIVPFLYFIRLETTKDFGSQERLEDACLHDMHVRVLAANIKRMKITMMFFEFILAGNRGQSSYKFLSKLRCLLKFHGVQLVIDEILTIEKTCHFVIAKCFLPSLQNQITHIASHHKRRHVQFICRVAYCLKDFCWF